MAVTFVECFYVKNPPIPSPVMPTWPLLFFATSPSSSESVSSGSADESSGLALKNCSVFESLSDDKTLPSSSDEADLCCEGSFLIWCCCIAEKKDNNADIWKYNLLLHYFITRNVCTVSIRESRRWLKCIHTGTTVYFFLWSVSAFLHHSPCMKRKLQSHTFHFSVARGHVSCLACHPRPVT